MRLSEEMPRDANPQKITREIQKKIATIRNEGDRGNTSVSY